MNLVIIAAVAENRVIGNKGKIPWYIPEDFRRFRSLTLGHPVIMGRKTFESIIERNKKPLDRRRNIVVSSSFSFPNIEVASTLEEALNLVRMFPKAYIIGGERMYKESLPLASALEITEVKGNYEGDSFFPEIGSEWKEKIREDHERYSFVRYEKT